MARPIIKLIQYILSRKVQLNSWQALIKPWDRFCGPLEVRTHPLPPPDSGASFLSFGVFIFVIWVFRFRSRVLRFRDLGVFVFDLGCFVFEFSFFVFESWVRRFRDLDASCFGLRFRVLHFRNYCRPYDEKRFVGFSLNLCW